MMFIILPLAFLAACSVQSPFSPDASVEGWSAHMQSGSGALTGSGAVSERLLSSGMLEIGSAAAPLTMLHITNTSCSYCRQFARENMVRLVDDFVHNGNLRITIALMPLKKYPESRANAGLLYCATLQGKGWPMLLLLMEGATRSSQTWLRELTLQNIDIKALQACSAEKTLAENIAAQESVIGSLGVTFVPTSFLNGEKIQGVPAYPDLRGRMEKALESL